MGHPAFDNSDFLGAALALAAEHGPSAVTVAAISATPLSKVNPVTKGDRANHPDPAPARSGFSRTGPGGCLFPGRGLLPHGFEIDVSVAIDTERPTTAALSYAFCPVEVRSRGVLGGVGVRSSSRRLSVQHYDTAAAANH